MYTMPKMKHMNNTVLLFLLKNDRRIVSSSYLLRGPLLCICVISIRREESNFVKILYWPCNSLEMYKQPLIALPGSKRLSTASFLTYSALPRL